VIGRPDIMLFDLDGTLIDSVPDIATAVNAALAEMNRPTESEERIRSWVGRGLFVLIGQALTDGGEADHDDHAHTQAVAAFRRHYATCCTQRTQAFDGAVELLAWLQSQGIGTAIVTNKPVEFARRIASALSLPIDVIIGAEADRPLKPDPAPLHDAVAELNGGDAWMVGDTVFDLEAARAAAMPFIGVQLEGDTGRDIGTLTTSSEPVFESLVDFRRWLQGDRSL